MHYRHLISNIPNNFLTRWMVRFLNRRMAKSDSRHRLKIRYRSAKRGTRSPWGEVRRKDARRFAVYVELTPAYLRSLRENIIRNEILRSREIQ